MLQAGPSRPYHSPGQLFHAQATAGRAGPPADVEPSAILQSIRSIFPAYDSTRHTTIPKLQQKFYPLQDPYADRRPPFSLPPARPFEELAWFEDTLIWSKGASVFRTFTYAHEKQQVQHACFAWFESEGDAPNKGEPSKSRSAPQPFPNTFGPFATSYSAKWGEVRPESHASVANSGRCLVVFLDSIAHVYLSSGEDRIVHLPFAVEKVVALEKPARGLILQRKLTDKESGDLKLAGRSKGRQHRLYAMLDPSRELTPLGNVQGAEVQVLPLHLELVAWAGPLAVLRDSTSDELVFCQWSRAVGRRGSPVAHSSPSPNRKRRRTTLSPIPDQDPIAGPSKPRTSVSRKSVGRKSLAGPTEAEHSMTEAEALRAALDPNADRLDRPGPHRRLSDRPGRSRQTSTMDAPRAADRLSLLGEVSEMDLRETTMLMGLEGATSDIEEEAELLVTEIRRWPVPVHTTGRVDCVTAFLSDVAPHSITHLNVHVSAETSCLFVFSLRQFDHRFEVDEHRSTEATAVLPVYSTRSDAEDVLVYRANHPQTLLLLSEENTFQVALHATPKLAPPVHLATPKSHAGLQFVAGVDDQVLVRNADGDLSTIAFSFQPRDPLTLHVLAAMRAVASSAMYASFRAHMIVEGATPDNLGAALLAFCDLESAHGPADNFTTLLRQAANTPLPEVCFGISRLPARDLRPAIIKPGKDAERAQVLIALHSVSEELRLRSDSVTSRARLMRVIVVLALSLGLADWLDYYLRLDPTVSADEMFFWTVKHSTTNAPSIPLIDYTELLGDILCGNQVRLPVSSSNGSEHMPNFAALVSIFACLRPKPGVDTKARSSRAARRVTELGFGLSWILGLPYHFALPILDAIQLCRHHPNDEWDLKTCILTDRLDVAAQKDFGSRAISTETTLPEVPPMAIKSAQQCVQPARAFSVSQAARLPSIRFATDRRLQDVERLLATDRIRALKHPASDQEDAMKQAVQQAVYLAFSQIIGRGLLAYASREVSHTSSYRVEPLVLQYSFPPLSPIWTPTHAADLEDWPKFHNGAASGLAIKPGAPEIDSSWIAFHKTEVPSPEQGGFLLGLGLNGHLRSLTSWHAYPFLSLRHDFTSVGLLLGLSASYAGSQDRLLTTILSSGVASLLPPGAVELNTSPLIQSASIMGIGLVHAGSAKHRMADAALSEIGRGVLTGIDMHADHREAYSFSAACAFGLIMLGRGGGNPQYDLEAVTTLRRCFTPLGADALDVDSAIDVNTTAPGATLALGLMYLRTGRKEVSSLLSQPQDLFELDHIRPDLLMIRAISIGLIHWDDVEPTQHWLDAQLPEFIRATWATRQQGGMSTDQTIELAYYNIIAGACFVVGLKYASSISEDAYKLLTSTYATFSAGVHVGGGAANSYEDKIRKAAIRQGQNLIMMAYAIVVVGTGDIAAYRKFRMLHAAESGFTYGARVASHMATGMLFMGAGRCTFGTSNFDIAALCISCFPRFGSQVEDNRAYLQAYRHFWALAAQPTCVSTVNVADLQSVYLPLKADYARHDGGATESRTIVAPALLNSFESMRTLSGSSPRYLTPVINVPQAIKNRQLLLRSQTVFVKQRPGFMDYTSDPKGNLTLHIIAGPALAMGWNPLDGAVVGRASVAQTQPEMQDGSFVKDYAHHPLAIAVKGIFGEDAIRRTAKVLRHAGLPVAGESAWGSALDDLLLEALLTEKNEVTSLVTILSSLDCGVPEQVLQLQWASRYYASASYDAGQMGRRIRASTLSLVRSKLLRVGDPDRNQVAAYFRNLNVDTDLKFAWYLNASGTPSRSSLAHMQSLAKQIKDAASSSNLSQGAAEIMAAVRLDMQEPHLTWFGKYKAEAMRVWTE